jgi:hypothetical protein
VVQQVCSALVRIVVTFFLSRARYEPSEESVRLLSSAPRRSAFDRVEHVQQRPGQVRSRLDVERQPLDDATGIDDRAAFLPQRTSRPATRLGSAHGQPQPTEPCARGHRRKGTTRPGYRCRAHDLDSLADVLTTIVAARPRDRHQ